MHVLMDQTHEPFVASESEAIMARAAADRLRVVANANQDVTITLDKEGDLPNVVVPLPARAVTFIHMVLETMANRTPMSLIPYDAVLTTQQAADYLNVSRPYLVQQIDNGMIAFSMVGTHRRIKFCDLKDYEQKMQNRQKQALKDLNEEARKLGLE